MADVITVYPEMPAVSIQVGLQGIPGVDGQDGVDGVGIATAEVDLSGDLIVTLTDATVINAGHVVGADGADGADGINGANGIDGADGADGQDGAPGSVWYTGSGAPSGGTGIDGDYYLNTANGDVYAKAGGSWSVVGNIKGPTGATGATGTAGTNGTNGANGQGVPTGGATGQLLSKINGTDYNTQWIDPPSTGAPADAQYLALATNGTLTNERVLTAGSGLSLTDGGAGAAATLAVDINSLSTESIVDAAADHLAMYDASAGANRKITPTTLFTKLPAVHHPGFVSGRRNPLGGLPSTGATQSQSINSNTIYLSMWSVPEETTFTSINIIVVTQIAGSNARLGIYANNHGVPGSLLSDCGIVSTASTGDRTIGSLSLKLAPGFYWLACLCSAGPTLTALTTAAAAAAGMLGMAAAGSPVHQMTASQTYGALGSITSVSYLNQGPIWIWLGT